VNKLTEACLGLDNAERNVHLTAEGGKPYDEFNGLNVMCNDDELSTLGLNEVGDVVETVLDEVRLGGLILGEVLDLSSSSLDEAILLLLLGLRDVLSKEAEEGSSYTCG